MKQAQKFKELLNQRRWSIRELAKRAAVSQSTANRLAKRSPKGLAEALRVAAALEVPAEWLYDDSASGPPPRGGLVPADLADPAVAALLRGMVADSLRAAAESLGESPQPKRRKGGKPAPRRQ